MASVINIKESKEFCDEVYTTLENMKKIILRLKSRSSAGTELSDVDGGKYVRHLNELSDAIEWKLQILSHSCSYNWRGASDYDGDVQVDEIDKAYDSDTFSGGYIGG